MTKITEIECLSGCTHDPISENGFLVCKCCGLVLDQCFVETNHQYGHPPKDYGNRFFKQSVSIGDTLASFNLGSEIYSLKDSRLISKEQKELFTRLSKRNKNTKYNGRETLYRTNALLKSICYDLNLPNHIKDGAALRYKKLRGAIINSATAICFCIWDTIRLHKYFLNLIELFNAFRERGHRVNKHLLIRDGAIFSELLKQKGIKKSLPKRPKDYIPRIFNAMRNQIKKIDERLKAKSIGENPFEYLLKLEKLCYYILTLFQKNQMLLSTNPYCAAASCIYFSSRLYAELCNQKRPLTQKIVSEFSYTGDQSLRDYYITYFKPLESTIIKKLRGACLDG